MSEADGGDRDGLNGRGDDGYRSAGHGGTAMNPCPAIPATGAAATSLIVVAAALIIVGLLLVVRCGGDVAPSCARRRCPRRWCGGARRSRAHRGGDVVPTDRHGSTEDIGRQSSSVHDDVGAGHVNVGQHHGSGVRSTPSTTSLTAPTTTTTEPTTTTTMTRTTLPSPLGESQATCELYGGTFIVGAGNVIWTCTNMPQPNSGLVLSSRLAILGFRCDADGGGSTDAGAVPSWFVTCLS